MTNLRKDSELKEILTIYKIILFYIFHQIKFKIPF